MSIIGSGSEATIYHVGSLAKKKTSYKEISIIRMLGYHPNIIQPEKILGSTMYMPIADQDLFDYMAKPHNIQDVINIFSQIVKAVEWCHAHDVIHHDLKLENVLLFGNRAVLIDFGLSLVTTGYIQKSKAIGTEDYLAPEVLNHNRYNHSIDIYALGILWFVMITNKQPWSAAKMSDPVFDLFSSSRKKFWKWFDVYVPTERWFQSLFEEMIINRIKPIEILKRLTDITLDDQKKE